MLRVAGAPWLGTYSCYPPKTDPGKAVLGQLLTASRAWLWVLPDRNIPQADFRQSNKVNKKTRRQSTEVVVKGSALCLPQRCCELGVWIGFWRAVRRISLGVPQDFMPCGSCVSLVYKGISLPWPCTSCWRLFPLFAFQAVPWKNGFGISVHCWDIICMCDSGLFCNRHCSSRPPGCLLIMDVVFSCTV